jgi:hypothetical protein
MASSNILQTCDKCGKTQKNMNTEFTEYLPEWQKFLEKEYPELKHNLIISEACMDLATLDKVGNEDNVISLKRITETTLTTGMWHGYHTHYYGIKNEYDIDKDSEARKIVEELQRKATMFANSPEEIRDLAFMYGEHDIVEILYKDGKDLKITYGLVFHED